MSMMHPALARAERFCDANNLRMPILLAPMAGACPPSLSIAVANAGGLGACGALLMPPAAIRDWASAFREESNGGFQINLWIPDPAPIRDGPTEEAMCAFLGAWGPRPGREDGDVRMPDFTAQCGAILEIGPAVVSSIMGIYPCDFIEKAKSRGIQWFATVTTVTEARRAECAGADAIVAQGMEAGGHRVPSTRHKPRPAWSDCSLCFQPSSMQCMCR